MRRLGSWLGQLALLAALTFVFMVLYAHGPRDFWKHAGRELGQLAGRGGDGGGNLAAPK